MNKKEIVATASIAVAAAVGVSQLPTEEETIANKGEAVLMEEVTAIGNPGESRPRLLVIGDSLSDCKNRQNDVAPFANHFGWVARFQSQRSEYRVVCEGVAGAGYWSWSPFEPPSGQWAVFVGSNWPEVLVIMMGVNDATMNLQDSVATALTPMLVNPVNGGTSSVILVTEHYRDPVSGKEGIPERDQVIIDAEAAECAQGRTGVICVDFSQGANEMTVANGLIGTDGIHPNANGYSHIADVLAAAVPSLP